MSEPLEIWKLGTRGSNQIQHQRVSGVEGAAAFSGLTIAPGQRPEDFVFSQDVVRIGGYLFRRVAISPVLLQRPASVETQGLISFAFVLSGKMQVTQAGRTVEVAAGESMITIGWQPYSVVVREPTIYVSVSVGRDVLDSRGIGFLHAVRKLGSGALLPAGMAGFFLGLFEPRLYPLSLEQTTRLSRVFDTFIVELHLGYVEEAKAPEDRVGEQRAAILEFARSRAGIRPLTVAGIAEHYNMSTRSLQRLFQGAPRSLRDELRQIQAVPGE